MLFTFQDLAPLILMFNVAVPNSQFVDEHTCPAAVHAIQRQCGVSISVRVQQKQLDSVKQLITVRSAVCSISALMQAVSALFELFTGHKTVSGLTTVLFCQISCFLQTSVWTRYIDI